MLDRRQTQAALQQCLRQPVFILARDGARGLRGLPASVRRSLCRLADVPSSPQPADSAQPALLSAGPAHHEQGYRQPDGGGIYAGWHWDGATLQLFTDRYGIHPLYYFWTDGVLGVSRSLPALLAAGAPADLDMKGLSVFLRVGYFVGERTAFRHIRVLPEGGSLVWKPLFSADSAPQVRSNPVCVAPCHEGPVTGAAKKRYMDGYIDLFRQAVSRCLSVTEGPVGLPLSGGRDSRHILLELHRQNRLPQLAVTARHFPPRGDDDADIAAELARRTGCRHEIIGAAPSRLTAEWCCHLETDFCADEHSWARGAGLRLKTLGCTVFDGLGGDNLSESGLVTEERCRMLERGEYAEFARGLTASPAVFSETAMRLVLRPELYAAMPHEMALAELEEALRRCSGDPRPARRFFFTARLRREVALLTFGVFGGGIAVAPFLDASLHDYLCSLPHELLVPRGFHSMTITAAYPEFADIPFEKKGTVQRDDAAHSLRLCRELAMLGLRRRSRLLNNAVLWPRLLRGALDSRYGASTRWFTLTAAYLYHLEEMAEACGAKREAVS